MALRYQNPLYLCKAQRIQPVLYSGSALAEKHNAISLIDIEETLILAKESRIKIKEKQNDPLVKEKKVNITPIDYASLNKSYEHFVPKKQLSAEQAFCILRLKKRTFQDIMCTAMHADLENKCGLPANDDILKYADMEKSYIDEYNMCLELEA
ncbi:hypothetical protein Tco_1235885 [Tanacetum coccineum]